MSFCKFASDVTLWREFYLNTEVAAVDVVPQEQVAGCGGWSSHFKQLHKIKELPVDVSTNWKINQRTVNVTESKGFTPLLLLFVLRVRCQRHSLLTQRCWCWFWGERKQEGRSRRDSTLRTRGGSSSSSSAAQLFEGGKVCLLWWLISNQWTNLQQAFIMMNYNDS